MSWFNVSDWGASSWAEEADAALSQAQEWLTTTVDAREWSSDWAVRASNLIAEAAYEDADPPGFWVGLAKRWQEYDADAYNEGVEGWSSLGETFAQAGNASYTLSEARESGNVIDMVGATFEATATEVKDTFDPTKSWVPWAIGLGLGVVFYVKVIK